MEVGQRTLIIYSHPETIEDVHSISEILDLTSIGFPSLAIIYIGIYMKKARIIAYWLSKKELREAN